MTRLKEKKKTFHSLKMQCEKNTVNVHNVCTWQNGIMSNIIYL